jgi:iron complex transport system substrate-binding protein
MPDRARTASAASRRDFLTTAVLAAAGAVAGAAVEARARESRGARRVFAAGPPAAVLTYVLAPEALVGWPSRLAPEAARLLGDRAAELPVVGRLAGRSGTVSLEALMAARPDLVLDVGTVDATYESFAERVRQQTGLRYELIGGRLADSPEVLRREDARRIIDAVARRRSAVSGVRAYLARGPEGLETGLRGSINSEVLDFVGATNVAGEGGGRGITPVSMEQVLAWNPDTIVTQEPGFAARAAADPLWRRVAAVRTNRVLTAPAVPFGWLDAPPGVNRLLGADWLSSVLAGDADAARLSALVRDFHQRFYDIRLSDADVARLLRGGA